MHIFGHSLVTLCIFFKFCSIQIISNLFTIVDYMTNFKSHFLSFLLPNKFCQSYTNLIKRHSCYLYLPKQSLSFFAFTIGPPCHLNDYYITQASA
jgi:hypothetical protein